MCIYKYWGIASAVMMFIGVAGFGHGQDIKQKTTPKNLAVNPGFEKGKPGEMPESWFFPPICKSSGYKLTIFAEKPFEGKHCAVITRDDESQSQAFGNIIQSFDAKEYRGKRIRYKAAVRANVKGNGNQAQLWFRVDRAKEQMGFFDNMGDRPITSKEWKHYEIVGDIADDAESIVVGMFLLGNGLAAIDDVSIEVVDRSVAATGESKPTAAPGLMEVRMAHTVTAQKGATTATYMYPLPLAYRDQTPLTFHLTVEPAAAAKAVEIVEGPGPNRILKLTLHELDKNKEIKVAYHSLMLIGPTDFASAPKAAKFPKEWPAEAKAWLASTWCCDHEHERIKKLAEEIRGDSDDVMAVVRKTLETAKKTFAASKGRVNNLTAVEALDKQGSCTSCANLVAALLRGAGVPARILSGYPTWSGPLQTHYIVEAYVPDYGWYPVESTMCQAPWPNHQQVNVSIIPIEHESQKKSKQRNPAAGGVPYLSLSELEDPTVPVYSMGTLKKFCDHECRIVKPIMADAGDWVSARSWARTRWDQWLKSKPALVDGKMGFGPATDAVQATSLVTLKDAFQ